IGSLECSKVAWIPTVLGLLLIWGVLALDHRRRGSWCTEPATEAAGRLRGDATGTAGGSTDDSTGTAGRSIDDATECVPASSPERSSPTFDRWQAGKGLGVSAIVLIAFLFTSWPRELVALGAAGALLTSRKVGSRDMLGLVDWQLLVLFIGLFVVNDAFDRTGLPAQGVHVLRSLGISLDDLPTLLATSVVLSIMVSNVPAIMLLLPAVTHPLAGPTLALASTFAGNL